MNPTDHPLREVAALFLKLGTIGFGGPAAHIAMMREEVVRRRKWVTDEQFLDLLGATNLIPGPNSTELAIHIGWQRRRWAGLLVAGAAFILPAALITGALGWAYVRFGALPAAGWLMYGVKPVILAVVVQAIWGLGAKALKTARLRGLAGLSALLAAFGMHELAVLFGAGGVAVLLARAHRAEPPAGAAGPLMFAVLPPAVGGAAANAAALPALFAVFVKIGSVLFGSGYVLLAFLEAELVERLGWLAQDQLIDAIAIGQVTPGPLFTTATFVGYVLGGSAGALAATSGIFLPAFVFVAASAPLVPRLRRSWAAAAFLDGVNVASLSLMAVVTAQLFGAAVTDPTTVVLLAVSLVLLVRFKVSSTWLILGGALVGWLGHVLR